MKNRQLELQLESNGLLRARHYPNEEVIQFELYTDDKDDASYNNLTYEQVYELLEWLELSLDLAG